MAVAIPLAIAAWNIYSGEHAKSQAKKQAARNAATRPKFQESQLDKDALSLAESELSTGQSAKAKQAYEEGSDADFSTSMSGILSKGGSVNDINSLFGAKQRGRQAFTQITDQLRLGQIDRVVRAQQMNEDQREKAFDYNVDEPWKDAAQATAAAREQSSKQISEGINTAGSALTSYLGGVQEKNDYSKYFGPTNYSNPGSNSSSPNSSGSLPQIQGGSASTNVAGSVGPAPTTPNELNYNWDYHNSDFKWNPPKYSARSRMTDQFDDMDEPVQ